MKIVIATGLYPPDIGGPATYSKLLEGALPERGIEPVIVPFGAVRHLPKVIRHLAYAIMLLRRGKGASVIYALDPISVGAPALLACKLSGKKLILRVAGDQAWEQAQQRYGVTDVLDVFVTHTQKYPSGVRRLVSLERRVAKSAAHVVVPSEYLKRILMVWGVAEDNITVIYNSYEPVMITDSRESLRAMFEYKGPVMVSAGRLVPWKGFRTLIDLMPGLLGEIPDLTLVIIGDGPQRAALEARAKELNVSERVRFAGRQPKETLMHAIKGADLFVLNTGYEGFSHQLLEVMALGVPVVTTNVGGNPELIEDGKEGQLVPFDDKEALQNAITRVLSDEELRAAFVAAAESKAHSFELSRMLDETSALLSSYKM